MCVNWYSTFFFFVWQLNPNLGRASSSFSSLVAVVPHLDLTCLREGYEAVGMPPSWGGLLEVHAMSLLSNAWPCSGEQGQGCSANRGRMPMRQNCGT